MQAHTLFEVAALVGAVAACERVESAPVAVQSQKKDAKDAKDAKEAKEAREAEACSVRDRLAAQHLKTFDDLDFNVFSNQRWSELQASHSKDIVVHWPDGRSTKGLDVHVSDLDAMFAYAPDTQIKEHPIKIANGEWTAVMGIIEGTFTKPMTLPDGTTIEPTDKKFRLPMATLGHWTKDGVMDEEYLFWDSGTLRQQMGIGRQ
jgi:hypothetical protein